MRSVRIASMVTAVATMAVLSLPGSSPMDGWPSSPGVHGVVITAAAAACLVGAAGVVGAGLRARLAEVALLGVGLAVLSSLSVLHGLAAGFGWAPLSWWAMTLAFPAGALAGLPLLLPDGVIRRWIGRRWRGWSFGWLLAGAGGLLVLLLARAGLPAAPAGLRSVPYAMVAVAAAAVLAGRQLRLYRIGRQAPTLVTAFGLVWLAAASAAGIVSVAGSPRWWAAHAIDSLSVLATAAALAVLALRNRSLAATLAPVIRDDPVAALELGLVPEVHAFIAALDRKDPSTRDHVVRVAELAIRTAARAGLPGSRLRRVGLGAMMHDIGKLLVPTDILTKPGALTDDEFAAIKSHALQGAALLERSDQLAEVAPLVRWHHERHDGTGYPDGLRGEEIPFDVTLISACDAWDAITHTRHYRAGRSNLDAEAVLQGGAGSQWHPQAVAVLLAEVRAAGRSGGFDQVGAHASEECWDDEVCLDALPPAAVAPERWRRLFEEAPLAYFTVAPSGIVTGANERASAMLGRPTDTLVGSRVLDLYAEVPEGRPRAEALLASFRAGGAIRDEELAMHHADGRLIWIRLTAVPSFDGNGALIESRSIAVEIGFPRRAEDELRRLALVDELTGLANRRAFVAEAVEQLSAGPDGGWLSVAFVDVDGLKAINDRLGHAAGDQTLVDVADALRAVYSGHELVARLGGDEFVVLTTGASPIDAASLARRLDEHLADLAAARGGCRAPSVSVGAAAARLGKKELTLSDLLAEADGQMYRRKANAGSRRVGDEDRAEDCLPAGW